MVTPVNPNTATNQGRIRIRTIPSNAAFSTYTVYPGQLIAKRLKLNNSQSENAAYLRVGGGSYDAGLSVGLKIIPENGTITGNKNNDNTNSNPIALDTIGTPNLKASAVTTAKIDDGAVTTAKIDDGAVTKDKIGTDNDTTNALLYTNSNGDVEWGKISRNSEFLTGSLSVANGGTGNTNIAFTNNTLIYYSSSNNGQFQSFSNPTSSTFSGGKTPILSATGYNSLPAWTLDPKVTTITATGTITAQSFNATSDYRLKTDISKFEYTKSILDLPIYKYRFKDRANYTIGCMAQDLQNMYPELVHEGEGGYLSIEESKLIYLLIEEVSKLRDELNAIRGN